MSVNNIFLGLNKPVWLTSEEKETVVPELPVSTNSQLSLNKGYVTVSSTDVLDYMTGVSVYNLSSIKK